MNVNCFNGRYIYIDHEPYEVKRAAIAANASGDNTIVAAVASRRIRVLSWALTVQTTGGWIWKSSTTSNLTGLMAATVAFGFSVEFNPFGHFQTVAGELLNLNTSGAIGAAGHLTYIEVP